MGKGIYASSPPKSLDYFQHLGQQNPTLFCSGREESRQGSTLTLLGGFETIVEVNPLNIVSQGSVGQQSPVPVDDVGRKSKGMLLGIHDLGIGTVCILKDSSCKR